MYIKKIKTDKENKAVVVTTGERERGGAIQVLGEKRAIVDYMTSCV